jgi:hypothetical protein
MASIANSKPDLNLRSLFGLAASETIKSTFSFKAKLARARVSDALKLHWYSRFPACVAINWLQPIQFFSDTPAVDSGYIATQLFAGRHFLVADTDGLKTDKEFVNTLEDNIRDKLISDCAKVEMS